MPTTIECYQANEYLAPFLRIETPRDKMALPYSTLLGITLSTDESILELDFASHSVTIKGRRLYEVFCIIASGRGEALFAKSRSDDMEIPPTSKIPFISEMRIKKSNQTSVSDAG